MNNKVFGPIHGAQRVLTVYDDHIELEQVQNFRSFMTNSFFNGDKEIYYTDMISCQYKEGSSLILGYLQFETPGQYNRNNFGSENSFTFESVLNEQIFNIYQYIKKRIREVKNGYSQTPNVVQSNESVLDELIKMKKLLDENIITQEEFDQFKSKCLNPQENSASTSPSLKRSNQNNDGHRWECECGTLNEPSSNECEYCGRPRKDKI